MKAKGGHMPSRLLNLLGRRHNLAKLDIAASVVVLAAVLVVVGIANVVSRFSN